MMELRYFLYFQLIVVVAYYCLQRLVNAVSSGEIDEIVALVTSGVDINSTLEVF